MGSPLALAAAAAAATKQSVNKLAFSNQHIIDSMSSIYNFKNDNETVKENEQEDIQANSNPISINNNINNNNNKIDDNTNTNDNNNNNSNNNELDASKIVELSNSASYASKLTLYSVTDKTNNNQEKTSNNNIGHANDFYSNNKSLLMSLHQNEITKNNLNYRPLFQPFILFQQKPQSNINLQQVDQQQQEQISSLANTIAATTKASIANTNLSATTINHTASSGSSLALNTNCNQQQQQQQQYFEQSKLQLQSLNTHFQFRINEENLITKSSYQLKRNQLYFKPY